MSVNRSIPARVQAQASTHQGGRHWLLERVTSVALVPLTLWFIVSAVSLSGAGYEEVRLWLAGPFNTTCMLLLVVTLFWHTQLGLTVIVEDYVHHEMAKLVALTLVNFTAIALGLACAVAVLKVSLGS
ncbi:MAG TPA: succinate dehydrogenase, hydrophobic membrane anchor protein [Geminicoccaceae bacterium]|nr:succinate dehydrogenase, hydrophobic membrane anchor protein [Geminicoccaceae bacterium]